MIVKKIGSSNGSFGLCQNLLLRSGLKMEGVDWMVAKFPFHLWLSGCQAKIPKKKPLLHGTVAFQNWYIYKLIKLTLMPTQTVYSWFLLQRNCFVKQLANGPRYLKDELLVEKEEEGFINVNILNPIFFTHTHKKAVGYLKVNEVK